jgi:hypothetical protein
LIPPQHARRCSARLAACTDEDFDDFVERELGAALDELEVEQGLEDEKNGRP